MTLYLDTSALVAAAPRSAGPRRRAATRWRPTPSGARSGLTLMESLALDRPGHRRAGLRADLEDLVRLTWDRLAVVPVDQRCLDRAAALMRDAAAAAQRRDPPRRRRSAAAPVRFVTFDPAQIPVALSLGFDVVST